MMNTASLSANQLTSSGHFDWLQSYIIKANKFVFITTIMNSPANGKRRTPICEKSQGIPQVNERQQGSALGHLIGIVLHREIA